MAIKPFESREGLKEKLKSRGLVFNDKELETALKEYNYFSLFNGLETLLLDKKSPKSYDRVTLDDFLRIYKFDKGITSLIERHLNDVESKLKSCISHHFCSIYCRNLNDTMQYTNKNNYMDPKDSNPNSPTYCKYSLNYPFVNYQNKRIYNEFNEFALFRPGYLTSLVNKYDHIKRSFYSSPLYTPPAGVARYRMSNNTYDNTVAVPFWVSIETLTFGQIVWLLHYLKDDVMELVMKDFNLSLSKREVFLNMLDFLMCLRNNCAHTSLVNRFRTEEKYKINTALITNFSLNPENTNPAAVLKLYDVIKILSFFTDVHDLIKPLKDIRYINIKRMGLVKGEKLTKKMFDRMGCSSYRDWKIMLKKCGYIL